MINLKELRKQKKLTQNDMAKILNMSLRGYQDIETGKNETSFKNLIKIADFFGCSIDYLIGHQSKEIIYSDFTADQKKAIQLIKKLDERDMPLILGYLARMTNTPLEELKNT